MPPTVRSIDTTWNYPADATYAQFGYGFQSDTVPEGYSQNGYYSATGTVVDRDNAAQLPANSDHSMRDIEILYTPAGMAGDVNNDASLTLADVILSAQVVSGSTIPVPIYTSADINSDGKIGVAEAIYILNRLAHPNP